jgi:tetratricopeptide (TPR) repeat protein
MLKSTFFKLSIFGAILIVHQDISSAKTALEVKQIATSVTVKIELTNSKGEKTEGSGVIYQKQNDIYKIITNAHVACISQTSNPCALDRTYAIIITPDNRRYQILTGAVTKVSPDLDLATIQLRSSKYYPIAQIANSSQINSQETVYTAGFPENELKLRFNSGKVVANVKNRIEGDRNDGYAMLYDAFTISGMSGSGVFNSQGQIVAIHGQGDYFASGIDINDNDRIDAKIGINRGIPTNRLTTINNSPTSKVNKPKTADEFMVVSYNKSLKANLKKISSENREALKHVNQAIKLQPSYSQAYLLRGWIQSQLKNNKLALADYNQAISINPTNDNAYMARASIKFVLKDQAGSFIDYNKAISINPENVLALEGRGSILLLRGDNKNALTDFNNAIKVNSSSIVALAGRCSVNSAIGNTQVALQDCNKVIKIHGERGGNPNALFAVYGNRGAAKFRSGDKKGALEDLNESISLNPNEPNPYINRASVKYSLGDKQGALTDFNSALSLNSTNINVYLGIALIKEESQNPEDLQEALNYYVKAAEIYRQKGDNASRALVFYRASKLRERINPGQGNNSSVDSLNQSPQRQGDWLEETINQGILDLGRPRK